MSDDSREVLDFWFAPSSKAHWFEPSAAFDRSVAARLGDLHRRAASGDLEAWRSSAEGCVALCILLDQAPRQLFRGEARAFATDAKALAVAEQALAEGLHRQLPVEQREFLYLPLMHSERLADQERCVALYEAKELRHNLHHAAGHATSSASSGASRTAMRRSAAQARPLRRPIFARAASCSARSCRGMTTTVDRAPLLDEQASGRYWKPTQFLRARPRAAGADAG